MMHRRHSGLATLPIDLHVLIFAFLDPHDILQLRQTCKALHDATLQRIVWIEALRQICLRNLIYLPTFPLSKMSLSELEHAATVPQRWLKGSSHQPSQSQPQPSSSELDTNPPATPRSTKSDLNAPLLPHQITRRLHCPEHLNIPMDLSECPGEFNSFYLVPGGRFLVTFSWNWFAVWDLGINPGRDTIVDFQPLDAAVVQLTGMELVHPTQDGLGLNIFVSANEQVGFKDNVSYETSVCLIYEIYPQSANPELELVARLDTPRNDILFYSLSANRLIFMDGSTLKIWDYKHNAWASWSVEHNYDQIIVGENSIMLLWHDGVDVWPIPALTTSTTSQLFISSSPPPLIKPSLSFSYPSPHPQSSWCEGPCDWFSGTSQPFIYDLVCRDPVMGSAHLRRYEVVLASDLKSGELVERGRFELVRNSRRGSSLPRDIVAEEGSTSDIHSAATEDEEDADSEDEDAEDERDAEDVESGPQAGFLDIQPSSFLEDKLVAVIFDSRDTSVKVHIGSILQDTELSALPDGEAYISPAITAATPTSTADTLTLLTSEDLYTRPLGISFCPISARLAYLDDEQQVCIVDYFPKTSGTGVTWLDVPSGSREEIVLDAVLEVCDVF